MALHRQKSGLLGYTITSSDVRELFTYAQTGPDSCKMVHLDTYITVPGS